MKQRLRGYESAGVSLGGVAWSSLAESLGMAAFVATNDDELRNAILRALGNPGPALIDVHIDPSTYPDTLRDVRG